MGAGMEEGWLCKRCGMEVEDEVHRYFKCSANKDFDEFEEE